MSNIFSSYMTDIPEDLVTSLRSFTNKFRLILIQNLMENGALSIAQIQRNTNKETGYIVSNLKRLELAGMVQNFIQERTDKREWSFYEATKFCFMLIETLKESICEITNEQEMNTPLESNECIPDFTAIEEICKGVANRFRLALTYYFKDVGAVSFSEITNISQMEKSTIVSHLKKLEMSGIIQNFLQRGKESAEYSFYELTKKGMIIADRLQKAYNIYYSPPEDTIPDSFQQGITQSDTSYFEIHCASWALPNEPIVGWIYIYSKDIEAIGIRIPESLTLRAIYNRDYTKNDDIFLIENNNEQKSNFVSFELISEIPSTDTSLTKRQIEIIAFGKESLILLKKEITIEIIRPVIQLKVKNNLDSSNAGFFEITLSISKGYVIESPGIEIWVEDEIGKRVKIKIKEKDPSEFLQDAPPELKIANLIGSFEIVGHGKLFFHFRVPYLDAIKNQYYSNEEVIEIDNLVNFDGNFEYNYDFIPEIACV